MIEAEWLASECASEMMQFLRDYDAATGRKVSRSRKYRLFACACVRRLWVWQSLGDADRAAVSVAEQLADGQVKPTELRDARQSGSTGVARKSLLRSPRMAANDIARALSSDPGLPSILRDVFGNPYRTKTPDPSWLTPTVRGLAEGIYADRAFDRLPIMADALEDAGCDDTELLGHCRGEGPHVRGCWVVDQVLGTD